MTSKSTIVITAVGNGYVVAPDNATDSSQTQVFESTRSLTKFIAAHFETPQPPRKRRTKAEIAAAKHAPVIDRA